MAKFTDLPPEVRRMIIYDHLYLPALLDLKVRLSYHLIHRLTQWPIRTPYRSSVHRHIRALFPHWLCHVCDRIGDHEEPQQVQTFALNHMHYLALAAGATRLVCNGYVSAELHTDEWGEPGSGDRTKWEYGYEDGPDERHRIRRLAFDYIMHERTHALTPFRFGWRRSGPDNVLLPPNGVPARPTGRILTEPRISECVRALANPPDDDDRWYE